MTIRRLHPGDGMLYKEVRLAALKESPDAFSSRYEDAVNRSDRSWCEQADSSAVGSDRATFVAIEVVPVGLAAIYRDENEVNVGELLQMWVAPEKRGGLAAGALLDALFQWADASGFSRIKAGVMGENSRALRFYERYGFLESSDPKDRAQEGLVLTKSLG